MTPDTDRSRAPAAPGGVRAALRTAIVVCAVAASTACCPVPASTHLPQTAFVAVIADAREGYWVAERAPGQRYRIAGAPPAAPGSRVYLTGTLAPDGSLDGATAEPIDPR